MSESLKVGIVGMTSDHVWRMAEQLVDAGAVLVTGADPAEELRNSVKDRFGLETVYADSADMYKNHSLDAVLLCGDNAGKAGLVEEAASHNVHVMQDKPISATLEQAGRIVAASESADIKLMVAYHNFFGDGYGRTKEWINDGTIGDTYLARAHIGHAGPREIGCSEYFQGWLFDREKNGGGTFIDEACYSLSAFLDYLGPITEISAFMNQMGWRDYLPADVEDNSVAIVRFQSGVLGVIDSKWGQIGPLPNGSSYHGTEGTLLVGRGSLKLYSRKAGLPDAKQGWIDVPTDTGRVRPGIGGEAEYFVQSVLNDTPIEGAVSARGARATQEAIEAAYRSATTGQTVKLPL